MIRRPPRSPLFPYPPLSRPPRPGHHAPMTRPGHVREHPGLRVEPFLGDFERDPGAIPAGGPRMIAFLGSTVGNLEPVPRGPPTLHPNPRLPPRVPKKWCPFPPPVPPFHGAL